MVSRLRFKVTALTQQRKTCRQSTRTSVQKRAANRHKIKGNHEYKKGYNMRKKQSREEWQELIDEFCTIIGFLRIIAWNVTIITGTVISWYITLDLIYNNRIVDHLFAIPISVLFSAFSVYFLIKSMYVYSKLIKAKYVGFEQAGS